MWQTISISNIKLMSSVFGIHWILCLPPPLRVVLLNQIYIMYSKQVEIVQHENTINSVAWVSKSYIVHSRCSIWTVFNTQKIRCIKLYIALLTISRKKNSEQKQRKNTFKMQLKSRSIFRQTTSNEWNFNRHFYSNWIEDLM